MISANQEINLKFAPHRIGPCMYDGYSIMNNKLLIGFVGLDEYNSRLYRCPRCSASQQKIFTSDEFVSYLFHVCDECGWNLGEALRHPD